MSRHFMLEHYLEGFMDEHTEPAEDEIKLLVSDAQVQTVGLFFIEGMVGLIQCLRNERGTPLTRGIRGEQSDEGTDEVTTDEDDFIN